MPDPIRTATSTRTVVRPRFQIARRLTSLITLCAAATPQVLHADILQLQPTHDTFADDTSTQYCTNPQLLIGQHPSVDECIGYVVFPFSATNLPAGSTINSATVKLYVVAVSLDPDIGIYTISAPWNWNTCPHGLTRPPHAGSHLSRNGAISSMHYENWPVTAWAQGVVNGTQSNNGFAFAQRASSTGYFIANTRESLNRPILEVDYTPPSTPNSRLQVTPGYDFVASGITGSLSPASQAYSITNTGGGSLNWSAAIIPSTATWLTLSSPASGTLGAGQTATLTVSLSSAAYALTPGNYAASMRVSSNAGDPPQTVERSIIVTVSPSFLIQGTIMAMSPSECAHVPITAHNDGFSYQSHTNCFGGYQVKVPAGFVGAVSPRLDSWYLDPPERYYSDVSTNLSSQDFWYTRGDLSVQSSGLLYRYSSASGCFDETSTTTATGAGPVYVIIHGWTPDLNPFATTGCNAVFPIRGSRLDAPTVNCLGPTESHCGNVATGCADDPPWARQLAHDVWNHVPGPKEILAYEWVRTAGGFFGARPAVARREGERLALMLSHPSFAARPLILVGHSMGSRVATTALLVLKGTGRDVGVDQLFICDGPDAPVYSVAGSLVSLGGFRINLDEDLVRLKSMPGGQQNTLSISSIISFFGRSYSVAHNVDLSYELSSQGYGQGQPGMCGICRPGWQFSDLGEITSKHAFAHEWLAATALGSEHDPGYKGLRCLPAMHQLYSDAPIAANQCGATPFWNSFWSNVESVGLRAPLFDPMMLRPTSSLYVVYQTQHPEFPSGDCSWHAHSFAQPFLLAVSARGDTLSSATAHAPRTSETLIDLTSFHPTGGVTSPSPGTVVLASPPVAAIHRAFDLPVDAEGFGFEYVMNIPASPGATLLVTLAGDVLYQVDLAQIPTGVRQYSGEIDLAHRAGDTGVLLFQLTASATTEVQIDHVGIRRRVLGDIDGNGALEALDAGLLVNALLGMTHDLSQLYAADINRDGVLNGHDIAAWVDLSHGAPQVMQVRIIGDDFLTAGGASSYSATAYFSDLSTLDVTSVAEWSATDGTIQQGLFVAPQVTAETGVQISAIVTVRGITVSGFRTVLVAACGESPPVIAPIMPQSAASGVPWEYSPTLTEGTMPVLWSIVSGPVGMQIDVDSGRLTWMSPTTLGSSFLVGVRAQNLCGSDEQAFELTVCEAEDVVQSHELVAAGLLANDHFGSGVSVEGGLICIGASGHDQPASDAGSAYVFRLLGSTWVEETRLFASDGAANNEFGRSVAISGDRIAVGSANAAGGNGAVYFFRYAGGAWAQDGPRVVGSDRFGWSVGISGDHAVGGAYYGQARAIAMRRNGGAWDQAQVLVPTDLHSTDWFGYSVAISDLTVVIGSPNHDHIAPNAGAAYIFTFDGSSWTENVELLASDGAANDGFGGAVSIDGDVIVVGAGKHGAACSDCGAAYVFTRNGSSWTQSQKLMAPDATTGDFFGIAVAISGGHILIGADQDDVAGTDSGSAYLYKLIDGSWSFVTKITPSNGAEQDRFGLTAAIDRQRIIIGADHRAGARGSAYVFDLQCGP